MIFQRRNGFWASLVPVFPEASVVMIIYISELLLYDMFYVLAFPSCTLCSPEGSRAVALDGNSGDTVHTFCRAEGIWSSFSEAVLFCFLVLLLATCTICCSCMFGQQEDYRGLGLKQGWGKFITASWIPDLAEHSLKKAVCFLLRELKADSREICGSVGTLALFSDPMWQLLTFAFPAS